MDLVLQFLGRHLHDGDAPVRELVDEFRATRSGNLGRFRLGELAVRVPQKRCRTRISFTNSVGDKRSADSAPSGTSNVIVGIVLDSPVSGYRVSC